MAEIMHHSGLKDSGVRDFLAKQTRPNNVFTCENADTRKHLVNRVKKAKADLEAYDTGQALRRMFEEFGWTVYDVSDHVEYDKRTYMPFIGTKEELKKAYPDAEGIV